MTRTFDENYDDWKPGDYVVWEDEPQGEKMQIIEVDEYQRVWWMDDGKKAMTRAVNLLRVKDDPI